MKETITSSQNKHIKHMKSLHLKKNRDEAGQYVIEGFKLIEEALEYQKPIEMILACDEAMDNAECAILLQKCAEKGFTVLLTTEKIFSEVSQMESPQGVLAVIQKQEQDLEKLLDKSCFKLMLLDEVRDPGNVGTIIRTADACGLDGVILSKGCVDLYNSKTIRATMGSLFHLPVITDVSILTLIEKLKSADAIVYGADPHSSNSCVDMQPGHRAAIVIGNEAKGLSDAVKTAVSQNITIPMPGKAESLNAGIAAAILMYELAVRHNR